MNKKAVIEFFDKMAPGWDSHMVRNERAISRILDNARIREGVTVLDQTTPNMIQRISGIFERNALISKEI